MAELKEKLTLKNIVYLVISFMIIGGGATTAVIKLDYVGRDLCGNSMIWENITDIYYHNETFPAIARYYCQSDAIISKQECAALNNTINTDGCKWGGKLSSSKRSLYEVLDPELPKDKDKPKGTVNATEIMKKYCKSKKGKIKKCYIDESLVTYPIEVIS